VRPAQLAPPERKVRRVIRVSRDRQGLKGPQVIQVPRVQLDPPVPMAHKGRKDRPGRQGLQAQ
jgi:hypothetical protein